MIVRLLAAGLAIGISIAVAQPLSSLDRARAALEQGQLDLAARELAAVDAAAVDSNDYDFLHGALAVAARDYGAAILRFRAMLTRDPTLNRVRLELARAHFLAGEDRAAERQFRAALAADVPDEVRANVDGFLDQIRRRKLWSASVAAALAPDTNANAATTAQSVNLFGLPFELDANARRKSGVGVALALAGDRQWPLAPSLRFKTGAALYTTEYGDTDFTDRQLNGAAGLRWLRDGGGEASLLATASRRWYGGRGLSRGFGARLEGQSDLSARTLLAATVAVQDLTYDAPFADYSGLVATVNASLTHAIDSRNALQATIGSALDNTRLSALDDRQLFASLGYARDGLPRGFAAAAVVQATRIRYDAPLPAFGVARRDTQFDFRVSLANRAFDIGGFSPALSWIHTERASNIDLFDFARDRLEVGIVGAF